MLLNVNNEWGGHVSNDSSDTNLMKEWSKLDFKTKFQLFQKFWKAKLKFFKYCTLICKPKYKKYKER